jgi:signal peptidase II
VMGGVLGNLYDRTGMPALDWGRFHPDRAGEPVYAVRDYILLVWRWDDGGRQRITWPNFNIADSLLVCGAIAIVLLSFRGRAVDSQADPALAH